MKKVHKKIFGLFGLVLVMATTVFAVTLPNPEASATGVVGEMEDKMQVRVVGAVPNVTVLSPQSTIYTTQNQVISFTYENIKYLTVSLEHNGYECFSVDEDVDYNAGDWYRQLNLLAGEYGYGNYKLTIIGRGENGTITELEPIEFEFLPVSGSVSDDGGNVYLDLGYDETSGDIDKIEVKIYDSERNEVGWSPITIAGNETITANGVTTVFPFGTKRIILPFYDRASTSGTFRIEIIAYKNNKPVYDPFVITDFDYEMMPVPDTGSFLKNLNISKTDYLVTGLVIFSIVGISGFCFVKRKGKNSKNRR